MTTPPLKQALAALPARQLNLLAIGAVAIAAALAISAIRAPLADLRQQQARLLQASALAGMPAPLPAPPAAPAATVPAAAPTPLALIAAVSAGAEGAGVSVASAVPGPERTVAGLRQQTLDIQAIGTYAALLAWITGLEASQPAVGLVHLEMQPATDEPQRQVRLQLAIYSAGQS